MSVIVVIGGQWGDEGKGKIVDYLAQEADLCVRFNGADNAGHTVGEFKLHLVPCGIFNPLTLCIIGNGVAVNPKNLLKEIDTLQSQGISCEDLKISDKAHLIFPWHTVLDGLQEEERGLGKIGTTRRGVGPVFADKIARYGFRMGDLVSEDFETKLRMLWQRSNKMLTQLYGYQGDEMAYETILRDALYYKHRLSKYVAQTEKIIWEALDKNKRIVMEGAQGTLLDPDFGAYPQTTSSFCTTNGALQGSGVSWNYITEVLGVVKSYTTRVCEKVHPFPVEMDEATAHILREQAGEYGATTGRPRRIGWLDIPSLRYVARINGFTGLAITRMDNFGTFPAVKICYDYDKNGKPVYLEMAGGWGSDVFHKNAQIYLDFIESQVRVPIKLISYGPKRDQVIVKE